MKNKDNENKKNRLVTKTIVLVISFLIMLYYVINMKQYDIIASTVIAISNNFFILGISEYKRQTGLALAALLVGSICYSITYTFDSMISQGYPWMNVICYGMSLFLLLFTSGCIRKHKKLDTRQLLKPYATTDQSIATKLVLVLVIMAITMTLSASAVKSMDRLGNSGISMTEFNVIDYSIYTLIIILNFLLPFELAFRMKNGQIYAIVVRIVSLLVAYIIADKSTNSAYISNQFIVLVTILILVIINRDRDKLADNKKQKVKTKLNKTIEKK